MSRHVEHPSVVPEDVLSTVSVVHVPVDDEHLLASLCKVCGRYGDVVQQAKSHSPIGRGMMTGRSCGHESQVPGPLCQSVDRCQPTSGSEKCRVPRAGHSDGVRVDRPTSPFAECAKGFEILARVYESELLLACAAWLGADHGVAQACGVEPTQRGAQAGRLLRMIDPCVVPVQFRL